MNIRLFIGEVKKRRALWDQANRQYQNKNALSDGWREVAKLFNVEVMVAKQKWKNLRDTFRVELKKTKRYSTDPKDGPPRSLWAYYEDMYFLKDVLKTRRRELSEGPSNSESVDHLDNIKIERDSDMTFSPTPLDDNDNDNDNSCKIIIENITSLKASNDEVDTTQDLKTDSSRSRKRKLTNDDDGQDDDDQDDDLLFFRSLLPFVKRLDQDKKLLFRMNVQQMLYNQLYS